VAIATTFGPCTLAGFRVITDEVPPQQQVPSRVAPAQPAGYGMPT